MYQITINDGLHVIARMTRSGDDHDLPRLVAQSVQETLRPGPARLSVWHRAVRPGVDWEYEVDLMPQGGVSRTLGVQVALTVPVPQAS